MAAKLREIGEELRTVLGGRSNLIDSILPPLVFIIADAIWGLRGAALGALAVEVAWTW